MGQHLSYVFDQDFTDAILSLQATLTEVISNAHEQSPFLYPHLTVAQCDSLRSEELLSSVERLTKEHGVFPVSVDTIGIFLGKAIVLTPIPTRQLLTIHEKLVSEISGKVTIPRWLLPDSWMPHIGIVSPYKNADLPKIMGCLSREFTRMQGTIIGIYVDDERLDSIDMMEERLFLFRGESL